MSMLVESTETIPPDEQGERGCRMPAFAAIVNVARIHGEFVETKEGKVPVAIVAFFSNSYAPSATSCDGFFEYGLGSKEVVRWTPDGQGKWHREIAGTVTWLDKTKFRFDPK